MKKTLIFLFIIQNMSQHFCFAQKQGQEKIDSIYKIYLNTSILDSTRIKALCKVAFLYYNINPDSGMVLSDLVIKESNRYNLKKWEAWGYNIKGIIYFIRSNYFESLKNYSISLQLFQEIGDKNGMAADYNSIGATNDAIGDYVMALKNYFASLKIMEEIGNKASEGPMYNNIAIIYYKQGDYEKALETHLVALKIRKEIGDKQGIADCLDNIGNIYFDLGKYEEAIKNENASLQIRLEIGDMYGLSASYGNIGSNQFIKGNYSEAIKNENEALKIRIQLKDKQGIATCFNDIGNILLKQNKIFQAKKNQEKSLALAKEINSLDKLKFAFYGLAQCDSALNNFKGSYENYKKYILYRDSLTNQENTKKTVQLQMQYDFDKKESLAKTEQDIKDAIAHKELQKQKLVRNGFVSGFAVVLLFAGVFFKQRNKISKGKKRSDELLLNILPSEVAEELKLKGSAEAKQFDDVTVMFTDFKNFTQISESLSPAELVFEIHTCFKAFDNIMDKYHIEKIKTIGDSYMAAGGLPVVNKTHAGDVVKAALEIQQFMEEHFKSSPLGKFGGARIGIHTGPVVAGIVGIKKFAYDIWGDTVNIASRMESSSEAGKVNISGSTYELVKDKFKCVHRGKIQAKNKGEIDMYFVESISIVV